MSCTRRADCRARRLARSRSHPSLMSAGGEAARPARSMSNPTNPARSRRSRNNRILARRFRSSCAARARARRTCETRVATPSPSSSARRAANAVRALALALTSAALAVFSRRRSAVTSPAASAARRASMASRVSCRLEVDVLAEQIPVRPPVRFEPATVLRRRRRNRAVCQRQFSARARSTTTWGRRVRAGRRRRGVSGSQAASGRRRLSGTQNFNAPIAW